MLIEIVKFANVKILLASVSVMTQGRYHSFALQGMVLTQNMSSGVIFSTHSLVLQGVTRHNAGSYTCAAVNAKGETSSEPVTLRVQCEYNLAKAVITFTRATQR